jgi:hypothetical protein
MASVTRSSQRAEVPHQHHSHHHLPSPAGVFAHAQGGGGAPGGGRNKRPLDTHDRDFDVIKPKRTRITVEILAKGSHGLRDADFDNNRAPPTTRKPAATPTVATATTPNGPPTTTDNATSKPKEEHTLTKHQSKVSNGIKHELDRLQPQPSDTNTKEQGRKLRSQEATRFKSELSAYFPEYDEVIGNEPKEQRTFMKKTLHLPGCRYHGTMFSDPLQNCSMSTRRLSSLTPIRDALLQTPNAQFRSFPTPQLNILCEDMAMLSSTMFSIARGST